MDIRETVMKFREASWLLVVILLLGILYFKEEIDELQGSLTACERMVKAATTPVEPLTPLEPEP